MTLADTRYDAIVSQPSHPWTSGASHLYTREFFDLTRSKLDPGGIFVQWIGSSFVDEALFGSLMASMTEVFDFVHVYRPVPAALVFMASDQPIDLARSAPRALASAPESFGRYGIHRLEDFYASWTLDTAGVRALSSRSPMNTDDHNRLATRRLPPAQIGKRGIQHLDDLFAREEVLDRDRLQAVDAVAVLRRMVWNGERKRANRLLQALDPAQASAARGWVRFDNGQILGAASEFRRALEVDPDLRSARIGLIAVGQTAGLDPSGLAPAERALIQATEHAKSQDWEAIGALDASLAGIAPGHLAFPNAARLRAGWRIQTDDPARAAEAIAIVDTLLSRQRRPDHYLLRARAAAGAGRTRLAWGALDVIASRPALAGANLMQSARELARSLGDPPEDSTVLQRLVPRRRRGRS